MRGLFSFDSTIVRVLDKMADLVVLNLLVILFSIPIITIGPAVSALYFALDQMRREEGSPAKDFFRSFRPNLKQGILLWLISLAVGVAWAFSFYFYNCGPLREYRGLSIIAVLLLAAWVFCVSWIFPLQARFSNTLRGTIRNAMICTIAFLPQTILMSIINIAPLLVLWLIPDIFVRVSFAWVILWFSTSAYWNVIIIRKPFEVIAAK